MEIKLPVRKIIKFSNVDGPGNRMAIFLQGCNYDCDYCHNPETIEMNPVDQQVREYSVEELLEEIRRVSPFIRGITISGGESTLHYPAITELFKGVKAETKLTCFIDTNGSLPLWEERYREFVEVTDSFMLDVKAWDRDEHMELTGQGNESVRKNLKFLLEIDRLFEVRTVVVPGTLTNIETIREVSKVIAGRNTRYKIIRYRRMGVRPDRLVGVKGPGNELMEEMKEAALREGVEEVIII